MHSDGDRALEPVDALIEAVDLSRPELVSVRDAWEQRDLASARRAFARHLRQRNSPCWYFDPSDPPRTLTAQQQQEADDALAHRLTSISLTHQFGEEIDWSLDATSLPNSPVAVNHEWTWQLNRHSVWASLATAYNATGQVRYARELARQIQGWVRTCPPPKDHADQSPGSRWRTIEAGIRMLGNWPQVFFRMVRQPDVLDDETLLLMVDSMRQHALYLDRIGS